MSVWTEVYWSQNDDEEGSVSSLTSFSETDSEQARDVQFLIRPLGGAADAGIHNRKIIIIKNTKKTYLFIQKLKKQMPYRCIYNLVKKSPQCMGYGLYVYYRFSVYFKSFVKYF